MRTQCRTVSTACSREGKTWHPNSRACLPDCQPQPRPSSHLAAAGTATHAQHAGGRCRAPAQLCRNPSHALLAAGPPAAPTGNQNRSRHAQPAVCGGTQERGLRSVRAESSEGGDGAGRHSFYQLMHQSPFPRAPPVHGRHTHLAPHRTLSVTLLQLFSFCSQHLCGA